MKVLSDTRSVAFPGERSVITIGAYDGLHRGHQAVIGQVRDDATQRNARSVVVTFDTHPASVVRPENAPKLLTSPAQRVALFAETGVDATLVLPFGEAEAQETAHEFIERVIVGCLRAERVIVGEDFHFGAGRTGNVALLRELGPRYGFDVAPVELLERDDGIDEPISSTAIRRALAGGNVAVAAWMLGRPFEVAGTVIAGDQRGRQIGFPTANIEVPSRMCLPADGVYAGVYERPDGSTHFCAINIGRRPTFYEHADTSLLEAHLLDFSGDLYGETARVRFLEFLRSERKFDGIEAIREQLTADVAQARTLLGCEDPPTASG